MKRICYGIVFAVSLWNQIHVFGDDDLFLGDLEEIGSEQAWDHSLSGGRKLNPWREKDNSLEFLETTNRPPILLEKPYKDQSYSLLNWENVDPEKFLSIDEWISETDIKSANPDWLKTFGSNRQIELMGRVLSCKGRCFVYRGIKKHQASFSSRIYEGDEFETDLDSVAWVFLNDGTLIRISPEGSLNFQEINFSETKIFVKIRLNKGHLFWNSRLNEPVPDYSEPETDSQTLPLRILEANQENFERKISLGQKDSEQLSEYLNLNHSAIKNQFDRISEFKKITKLILKDRVCWFYLMEHSLLETFNLIHFIFLAVMPILNLEKSRSSIYN